MAPAEALQTRRSTAGATKAIVNFVTSLRYGALAEEVRHYARRHLLDTVGVMIAGASGAVASRAEAVLALVRPGGRIPVPGRARRADPSMPPSSAARPRMASSSTTASDRGRCIRAAWWCRRRSRSGTRCASAARR